MGKLQLHTPHIIINSQRPLRRLDHLSIIFRSILFSYIVQLASLKQAEEQLCQMTQICKDGSRTSQKSAHAASRISGIDMPASAAANVDAPLTE